MSRVRPTTRFCLGCDRWEPSGLKYARERERERDRSVGNEVVARRECYLRGTNRVRENITVSYQALTRISHISDEFNRWSCNLFLLNETRWIHHYTDCFALFKADVYTRIYIRKVFHKSITNLIQSTTSNLIRWTLSISTFYFDYTVFRAILVISTINLNLLPLLGGLIMQHQFTRYWLMMRFLLRKTYI